MGRRFTPWLPLDYQTQLVQESTVSDGGVEISSTRSPYELPLSVRLVYDEDRKRGIFELRYAFEEPAKELTVGDVNLTVGRFSYRLLSIEAPVEPEDAETPFALIEAALPRANRALEVYLKKRSRRRTQRDNVELAREAMSSEELPSMAFAY